MGNSQPVPIPPATPAIAQPGSAPELAPQETLDLLIKTAERAHDDELAFGTKANEAAVKNAEEAIKAALLVNGGSCIAMLAFVGTLASRDALSSAQLSEIVRPLLYFGAGVAAAVVASAAAYFTNLYLANASAHRERSYVEPFIRPTSQSKRRGRAAEFFRWIGIIAVTASIACFIGGLVTAKGAFQNLSGLRTSPEATKPK